ncbi:MAG: HAMP domain-containing protein [Phycisphaerae bacterium]|nr:HAMP domain-containing protein [Phycisphaerae bacterium]
MRKIINIVWHKILVFLHLSPLSLAEKCRIAFGAAVIFILTIALILPYIWMGKLTLKSLLDSGKAESQMLQNRHFQLEDSGQGSLPQLGPTGAMTEPNQAQIKWMRFTEAEAEKFEKLQPQTKELIESIKGNESRQEDIILEEKDGQFRSCYVRIVRANENCVSCHNPQGTARPFGQSEAVGAIVIEKPAAHIKRIAFMNWVWIAAAWLIGGTGAIIAFYIITQRVILRPIRQLRALANNVTEGNLDIRSSIKTRDEYEKLSQSFNDMLDALQAGQKKLRKANKQLDGKIAELSGRNIELFKANKVKGEFLANMSHEFRTPLNAILGFAEIIKENPNVINEDRGKRYAENIIVGGKNLLNMINDLLDLAKSEAGKMKLHIEQFNIEDMCRSVIASFAVLTRDKKIKVKLIADEDLPLITTDCGKVRQILYNFLSNSVKFTSEQGRIEVRISMLDERMVRMSVSDSGCGIAEADREKIFEKFRQADGSLTRSSEGSGLGLAICKELATLLAGTIGLESSLDDGSMFWIDIPIALTRDEDSQEENNN